MHMGLRTHAKVKYMIILAQRRNGEIEILCDKFLILYKKGYILK